MTKYLYTTSGTCSKAILLTVEGDILTDAAYLGGCQGNTQGISRLHIDLFSQTIRHNLHKQGNSRKLRGTKSR